MHRRYISSTCRRLASSSDAKPRKKTHWAEELKQLNNVNRALNHFDDFYGSVYLQQWASLRLGLLSPPKYMAIPNTFTGSMDSISEKLEGMGAYGIRQRWTENHELIDKERKEVDMNKDLSRLHQVDKTLEAIAATKKAEELDVLYQNAPTSKREEMRLHKGTLNRIISDSSEAAADFVPSTKLKGVDDFTFDSEYFASYLQKVGPSEDDLEPGERRGNDVAEVQFIKSLDYQIEFPKLLIPYSFENGSALSFPAAGRDKATGLREYICVNGASIIPVMALNLRPDTNLLDLCAGPGTKSLLSLMTMSLNSITCNDLETSRLNRIQRIFSEFTGSSSPPSVELTKYNARDYPATQEFSRVLADVPCQNDRISCTVPDNNLFKPRRTKERLQLVKTQKEILHSALKALDRKDGSTVVYSTCTLSPIENDGVVMNSLKETDVLDLHIDLLGLMKLVAPFERAGVFRTVRTRCGVLVIPNTVCNFGPMYISRIVVKPTLANNLANSEKQTLE